MVRQEITIPSKNDFAKTDSSDRVLGYLQVLNGVGLGAVLVVGESGLVTYASPSVKDILGYPVSDLLGAQLQEYLHPDDVTAVESSLQQTVAGHVELAPQVMRVRSTNGEWLFLDAVTRRALGSSPAEIVIGLNDVTVRVKTLQQYKELEKQRNRAQRVARVSNWEMNTTTGMISGSNQFFRNFGLIPQEEMLFHNLRRFFHPDDVQLVSDAFRELQATFEPLDVVVRIMRADGQERVLQFRGEIELVGRNLTMFGTAQDITKSHRLQKRLQDGERRLRDLMGRLHAAQEEERKRIAGDVHDVLGQAMTALRMDISWIRNHVPAGDEELVRRVDSAMSLVENTIQTVRRISHELRPALLDHFGLVAALEWLSDQYSQRSNLACEFVSTSNPLLDDLDTNLATAMYRIYQEALTNVVRHSGATHVAATLDLDADGLLTLRIRDDGKGIDTGDVERSSSLGLLNMKERVLPWEGVVTVGGSPLNGTTVEVRVPFRPKETAAAK